MHRFDGLIHRKLFFLQLTFDSETIPSSQKFVSILDFREIALCFSFFIFHFVVVILSCVPLWLTWLSLWLGKWYIRTESLQRTKELKRWSFSSRKNEKEKEYVLHITTLLHDSNSMRCWINLTRD
jgi:hypothetical protein